MSLEKVILSPLNLEHIVGEFDGFSWVFQKYGIDGVCDENLNHMIEVISKFLGKLIAIKVIREMKIGEIK